MRGKKQSERKEYLQNNWTTFRRLVVKFIQENNGIASMAEVFDMYTKAFQKTLWSTPKLEELAKFLATYGGCFRIDLTINHPKPLAIYPGHHRIKTTTFFVLNKNKKFDENGDIIDDNNNEDDITEDDHMDDVKKAQALLDSLVEKAKKAEQLAREKKNSRKHKDDSSSSKTSSKSKETIDDYIESISQKDQIQNDNDEIFSYENTSSHKPFFYEPIHNGYIPIKSARFQIFQEFILQTFGSSPFSVNDIVNNISFDLLIKIVKKANNYFPDVISKEPRLRHILIRCFPNRILKQIELQNVRESIKDMLLQITQHSLKLQATQKIFLFSCKNPHSKNSSGFNDKYMLFDSSTINFFDQFEIKYDFSDYHQIELFHQMIKSIELIENIDPHSSDLWLKRNALARPHRMAANKLTSSIVDKVVHEPYELTFPFNFTDVEKFIAENGENWINFQSTLIPIYDQNAKVIRKGKRNPNKGPIADFCEGNTENSFQQNPILYFDNLGSQDFEYLRGYDKNVIFSCLSANMQLMPNGLIVNLPRPWSKSLEILKELTGIDKEEFLHNSAPQNLNAFLINTFRDYHDLNDYTTVSRSVMINNFVQEGNELANCFEVSTSQYLQRFNLQQVRYQMPIEIAELVEHLKIISLTPKEIFLLNDARRLLSEINYDDIEDAVFFLKISRFMNQPIIDNEPDRSSRFRVTKRTLADFTLHRPSSLYENIIKYFNLAQDPNKVEAAAESNSGAVAFLLDPDVPLTVNLNVGQTNIDSNINISIQEKNYSSQNDSDDANNYGDADALETSFLDPSMIDATAVLLKMSKSSMTVTSKKQQTNEKIVVKAKTIGLPPLPSFDVAIDSSPNNTSLDKYETKLFFDFRDYSGDISDHLYSSFMQIFVIMFQIHPDENMNKFILVTRLVYSFILNGFSSPVSLNDIVKYFMDVDFAMIFDALSALEQFEFIYRINVNKAMPYFVSDVFSKNHFIKYKLAPKKYIDVKPHLWTCADGTIEPRMLEKLQMKLAEIVDNSPGIEFMEIANKMSALSLVDLYQILDVLELDEVIYSRFDIVQEGSIFDNDPEDDDFCDSSNLPSPSVDSTMFFYNLALSLNDPTIKQVRRYFYPTQRNNFNLALTIVS